MSEKDERNFHRFSLQFPPFNGRADLYFCYLKSEKLAHALIYLSKKGEHLDSLIRHAMELPGSIITFAQGESEEGLVIGTILKLLSFLRLEISRGQLPKVYGDIFITEYELLAQKILPGKALPIVTLPELSIEEFLPPQSLRAPLTSKGHLSPIQRDFKGQHKGQLRTMSDRGNSVLKVVEEKKRVTIKEIAELVKGCSEKTIQRELNLLIQEGFIKKEGERRWSVYLPAK